MGKTAVRRQGRPSSFTEAVATKICEGLVSGQSLRAICLADNMPNLSTVVRWLAVNENFRTQYALAREAQADTLADEILDIADNGTNDWMERERDGESTLEYNGDAVQRSKLRVDARKWYASKLKPKVYGDNQKVDLTGSLTLEHWVLQSLAPAITDERKE